MLKQIYNYFEKYFLFYLKEERKNIIRIKVIKKYCAIKKYLGDNITVYISSWIYMIKNPSAGRHIFISCIPKSGSTYTQKVLEEGLPYCFRYYKQPRINYNLTGKGLLRLRFRCSIQRIHMTATDNNIMYLRKNNINKYIVLLRDPRDALVSYYHHIEEEGNPGYIHLTKEYSKLSKEDKITYLIKYLLPRLADFMNSWDSPIVELGDSNVLILYYEDMVEDVGEHFQKIIDFYNIPKTLFDTTALQIDQGVRYRKGRVGNWREYFTEEQANLAYALCGEILSRHKRVSDKVL